MSSMMEEAALPSVEEVSIARLHGLACWECGAVTKTLEPSHEVRQHGTNLVWTVSLCAGCRPPATS
ncbi:hypothetical protein ACFYWS_39240 [Streptomyces sp. NPDC002795]|uniref:hypothetical protein n=1 Tax=Streptomyces sp. NPDC002795 TaxID=3364665 RepID=UPI00368A6D74